MGQSRNLAYENKTNDDGVDVPMLIICKGSKQEKPTAVNRDEETSDYHDDYI